MKNEPDKRLVAVMFTDMEGYTALMQQDEKKAIQMRKRHREVLVQQHNIFRGEIIQYFGDGTLSIFANSSDAVACAIEIQKALHSPVKVPLRIGIHSGNVTVEEDGIYGDAVNIASRIESFANVGGILISDMVQDQTKNHTDWEFVSLGKYQLKNVARPFEIYAVSADGVVVPDPDFLQGKGQKVASFESNVPTPPTPILGRKKEIEALTTCLQANQVVTIIGPGGMGKTRLALELGNRLKPDFKEGIAFVTLATLTDATKVIPAIASVLDIKDAQDRKLIDGIVALIADKKALLILDNLEQVIEAAPEIAELAARCPHLKIICTSRTPLKIKAEQEFPLHPLSLPPNPGIDSLLNYPAIELFMNRAQQANMDFQLTDSNAKTVMEICQRVDGLPLALELAAARIRILPPDKLLHRLSRALDVLTTGSKDLPERHQTLRATIDWSHSLLNEAEQQLFRRLAVFAGGFTLEAIEAVCYENEDDAFLALDELESLLDKGLVENMEGGSRFNLLQTIKDFAMERLKASGEIDTFLQRHATYYFEISRRISAGMESKQQGAHIKQGVSEMANLQTTLDYLLKQAQAGDENALETGLQMCGELSMFWHIRGREISIRYQVQLFLDEANLEKPTIGICKAISLLSGIYWTLGNFEKGKKYAVQYFSLAEQLNHSIELLKSATFLSFIYTFSDVQLAKKYSEEALVRGRTLNNDYWLTWSLWGNGIFYMSNGNLKEAKERFLEAHALIKSFGENELKGTVLSSLAMLAVYEENPDEAIELFKQSLSAFKAVGARAEEARIFYEVSWVYLAKRNTEAARKYFLESVQAYQEVGSVRGAGQALLGLAAIEAVEGYPERAIQMATGAEHFAAQEGIVNTLYADNDQGKIYLDNARKELLDFEVENAEKTGRMLSLQEVLQIADNKPVLIV